MNEARTARWSAERVDLDAYFARIGYHPHGEAVPTPALLRQLHALHTRAIAFENLSPLCGQAVRLDLPSLQDKLIHRRRGGYCFEHNLLFAAVLTALGFQVSGLAARVRLDAPQASVPIRGHMLLLVEGDGRRLVADVGFGGLTLTAPLWLEPGVEQETPHEPFRVLRAADEYLLEARFAGKWRPLYSFDLQAQHRPDYEVTSWYLSNHAESKFVTTLMAARPVAGGRHALRNTRYSFRQLDGQKRSDEINEPGALLDLLEEAFLLPARDVPGIERRLGEIVREAGSRAGGEAAAADQAADRSDDMLESR